jgi:protein SCO1
MNGLSRLFFLYAMLVVLFANPAFCETPLKNFTLTSQNGKSLEIASLKGNYLFISFIYTRCPMPKMCPLTINLNKQVYALWKKKSPSIPLKFLIVTLDPTHDSPAVLSTYGKKMGLPSEHFSLLTGSEQVVSDFSSEFNAVGFPSEGLVAHNSKSVLVDPNLIPLKDYKDNEWKPKDVIEDILKNEENRGKKR